MAELVLVVGQVASGKTTRARQLAAQTQAVRLSPDEWMGPVLGRPGPDSVRRVLEGRLIWTAVEILRAGSSVILDFGFWPREERAALNWLATTAGARARTVWVPVDRETQARRVVDRRESGDDAWQVSDSQLEAWGALLEEPDADEIAGLYTLPAPPGEGWRGVIAERWPTALDGA